MEGIEVAKSTTERSMGDRLIAAQEKLGITNEAAAEEACVAISTFYKFKNGTRPVQEFAVKLLERRVEVERLQERVRRMKEAA